jgi:ankyrin repeat protein
MQTTDTHSFPSSDDLRDLLRKVGDTADYAGVVFDHIDATNALGDNALHCVCVWGDLTAAELLVKHGIDLHRCGEHGFTPLRVAMEFGHTALVEYLLAQGADPAALDAPERPDRDAQARHMELLAREVDRLAATLAETTAPDRGSGAGESSGAPVP